MATNQPQVNQSQPFNLTTQVQTSNEIRGQEGITSYGALLLPFDVTREKVVEDVKAKQNLKNKIKSAFQNAPSKIKNAIKNPTQTFKTLSKYMTDNRQKISGVMTTIGSKFSGIAVAQAIKDGNISTSEALDYLFMGYAPALGITGSLFGYSGLKQLKDSLANGNIDVGSFINGFSRTLKGATDLADTITNKKNHTSKNVIEFDLTASHSESYQSETPDRRVQSGQSLNEYIHNMPETIEVQCSLQDGRRYSKAEFRAILKYLRERKETVQLVLGDELFDSLVLTDFNPSHDCTRSGMDYSLSFKKIIRSDITTNKEVTIQPMPIYLTRDIESDNGIGSLKSLSKNSGKGGFGNNVPNLPPINPDPNFDDIGKQLMNAVTNSVKNYVSGAKTFVKTAIDNARGKK